MFTNAQPLPRQEEGEGYTCIACETPAHSEAAGFTIQAVFFDYGFRSQKWFAKPKQLPNGKDKIYFCMDCGMEMMPEFFFKAMGFKI